MLGLILTVVFETCFVLFDYDFMAALGCLKFTIGFPFLAADCRCLSSCQCCLLSAASLASWSLGLPVAAVY